MILGLALSLYKWLPAILEMKYTWYKFESDSITFVPLKSLLISPTNFGLLFQGHHGELNLIIGYIHVISIVILTIFIFKKKLVDKEAFFNSSSIKIYMAFSKFYGRFSVLLATANNCCLHNLCIGRSCNNKD